MLRDHPAEAAEQSRSTPVDHFIRAATAADQPAICAMLAHPTIATSLYLGSPSRPSPAQISDDWCTAPSGHDDFYLVLCSYEKEIIGSARTDAGCLAYFIAEAHRGRGNGRLLAQAITRHMPRRSDDRVWCAYTERNNRASICMLERMGFRFVGLARHLVHGRAFLAFEAVQGRALD